MKLDIWTDGRVHVVVDHSADTTIAVARTHSGAEKLRSLILHALGGTQIDGLDETRVQPARCWCEGAQLWRRRIVQRIEVKS